MINRWPYRLLFLLLTLTASILPTLASAAEGKPLRILCTTFPLYQLTRNLSQGLGAVQVDLLLPAQLGCPHDYALTPKDMELISHAEVLVVNGLGLEEFLGAPLARANRTLRVIDSSQGVRDLIKDSDNEDEPGPAGGHDHAGVNPHLFVSPRLTAQLAETVAKGLAESDPAHGARFLANGQAYAAKMLALDQRMVALGKRLANRRIITQHGVFDYLARDLGLEVVAVVAAHAGQEPSAAEMLSIIKTAKDKRVGGVFSEPQYPAQVVTTLAQEIGVPAATLDPMATGPTEAGLDYYERVMANNQKILQATLGEK